jgi:hypothetical protein
MPFGKSGSYFWVVPKIKRLYLNWNCDVRYWKATAYGVCAVAGSAFGPEQVAIAPELNRKQRAALARHDVLPQDLVDLTEGLR